MQRYSKFLLACSSLLETMYNVYTLGLHNGTRCPLCEVLLTFLNVGCFLRDIRAVVHTLFNDMKHVLSRLSFQQCYCSIRIDVQSIVMPQSCSLQSVLSSSVVQLKQCLRISRPVYQYRAVYIHSRDITNYNYRYCLYTLCVICI